jgi:hypothetical protein
MFGLKNQSILDDILHHEYIPQIWWNELIHNHPMITTITRHDEPKGTDGPKTPDGLDSLDGPR